MNEKPKVVKRRGRWGIVVPKGYEMAGFIEFMGLYGFARNQSETMDLAREHVEYGTFVKAAR